MRWQGESKGRGRRGAIMTYIQGVFRQTCLLYEPLILPLMACPCHTYEQHVLSSALWHFLVTPLITLPEFKCVGNPTILFSHISALGLWQLDFFLCFPRGLNDQYYLWCGFWKVHLECFRPLILCDHTTVLSIVGQYHLQTVHHISFCDADCPHSSPNILLSVLGHLLSTASLDFP